MSAGVLAHPALISSEGVPASARVDIAASLEKRIFMDEFVLGDRFPENQDEFATACQPIKAAARGWWQGLFLSPDLETENGRLGGDSPAGPGFMPIRYDGVLARSLPQPTRL